MHGRQSHPGFSAIPRAEDVARSLILEAPGGNEHGVRTLRVNQDVIEYKTVSLAEMGEARPISSAVTRDKQASRARSQENVVRVAGIVGQTAGVSSIRAEKYPALRPQKGRENKCRHNQ